MNGAISALAVCRDRDFTAALAALVNPTWPYFQVGNDLLVAHQKTLFKKASSSKLSLAKVVANRTGLRRTARLEDVPYQRAMVRIGEHFLLVADVSRFYSSIYTHSIDWAISSKARAKRQLRARRRNPPVGTMVDQFVQACQSGQTRGIPIGPATSMLLAEILLGREMLVGAHEGKPQTALGSDDCELLFGERSQAERALAILRKTLSLQRVRIGAESIKDKDRRASSGHRQSGNSRTAELSFPSTSLSS